MAGTPKKSSRAALLNASLDHMHASAHRAAVADSRVSGKDRITSKSSGAAPPWMCPGARFTTPFGLTMCGVVNSCSMLHSSHRSHDIFHVYSSPLCD